MKKKFASLIVLLLVSMFSISFFACKHRVDPVEPTPTPTPIPSEPRIVSVNDYKDYIENQEISILGSSGTVQVVYPLSEFKHLNFEYPYKAPDGTPATLSGVISISKKLYNSEVKKAKGTILYNHYTIMSKDEAPSKGNKALSETAAIALKLIVGANADDDVGQSVGTKMQIGLVDHELIIVNADYYGFGATEDKIQYYCAGDYNARCSAEALLAARKLLTDMGYTWDDYLLNMGYSQGGQTTMGVKKLVDEGVYNFNISASFAGSGPYDLASTFSSYLVNKDLEIDSSVVIYPIISFNTYAGANVNYEDLFVPVLYQNLNNWFISKDFSRVQIYDKMKNEGITKLSQALTSTGLNPESEPVKAVLAKVGQENLTKNWNPTKKDKVYIFYTESDTMVPPANATKMISFLEEKGFREQSLQASSIMSMLGNAYAGGDFDWGSHDFICRKVLQSAGVQHDDGGAYYFLDVIGELKKDLYPPANP